jgi:hypothetical protein
MRRATFLRCLAPCGGLFLAACGGATEPPEVATTAEPPPLSPPAPPSPAPEAAAWPDMTQEERLAHMRNVVMPAMKEVFLRHDAERFGGFGCTTCHGPGAKDGRFEMPSDVLPPLDPSGGFAAHKQADPATTAWMMNEVVPKMAEALGVPAHDSQTQEGFGCFGCHLRK